MKLSDLIKNAQMLLAKHGDLVVIDHQDYEVYKLSHEVAEGFPESYNMPDGTEFIRVANYP